MGASHTWRWCHHSFENAQQLSCSTGLSPWCKGKWPPAHQGQHGRCGLHWSVTIIRQPSDHWYDGRIPSTITISDHHPTITGTPVRTPSTPATPGSHNAGTIWSVGYTGKYLVEQW